MYVLCLITVTLTQFYNNTQFTTYNEQRKVEGKLIRQNAETVVADFSAHAKVLGLVGDYSEVLVNKSYCEKAR